MGPLLAKPGGKLGVQRLNLLNKSEGVSQVTKYIGYGNIFYNLSCDKIDA